MRASSYYLEGADGERFNWNISPTFKCPNLLDRASGEQLEQVELGYMLEGVIGRWRVTPEQRAAVEQIALALGDVPLEDAALVLERAHRGSGHHRRRNGDKLTDRCAACGAKMVRHGFRVWIDAPVPEDEQTSAERGSSRIGGRLGFDPTVRRTSWSGYRKTKRDAEAWARRRSAEVYGR